MSNLRFGIGKTLTSLPQNKELENGERKNQDRKEKEVSASNIINHDFYSEYSFQSAFLLINSFARQNFYLVLSTSTMFCARDVEQNRRGSLKSLLPQERQTLKELQYTIFRICVKFEHWTGIMKEKQAP